MRVGGVNIGIFLMSAFLLGACAVEKHLTDGEKLYRNTSIQLEQPDLFARPAKVKADMQELSQPKPNGKFGLWVYYSFGNPDREKGLGNAIRRRFGEEPVFYDPSVVHRSSLILQRYLVDKGYFGSRISYEVVEKGPYVDVQYTAYSHGRYRIRDIHLPPDSLRISQVFGRHLKSSYLRSGDYYDLANLAKERRRLATEAANQGYFDFDEDDVYFFVDSNAVQTPGAKAADIWLEVRSPSYGPNYKQYRIGQSYVYPNYDLSRADQIRLSDSLAYQDLMIYRNAEIIKPATLRRAIVQRKGDIYSAERQTATTNHLLDLEIYKFVNMKYRVREQGDTSFLDRHIYLTPGEVQNVRGALETTTRSGAFGMSVKASYSHKNIFHGAERLDLSLSTGFENGGRILVSEDTLNNNLVEVTARADLLIPRFVLPFFKIGSPAAFHIPRTRISFLANFQRRRSLFSLQNYLASFGYDWEETRYKRHQISLLSLNFVDITRQTPAFLELLERNPILERSFANLFITGSSYSYTFTNQEVSQPRDYFFFLGQLELAGHIPYLISEAVASGASPYRLFGRPFSQYTKIDVDARYHWVGRASSFVARISPGIGIPYLNAETLPYIKQYFVGGSNSMRAFPIRSLLGSYRADSSSPVAESAFDKTGELKIEANAEFRFDLFKPFYLKGAFFADVGNVWLLDLKNLEADQRKVFSGSRFISELAVGAGAGLRFDIQYLVLRLDMALPIRKPYLEKGGRWTFSEMSQKGWLGDNLNFNIALGYPF